MKLCRPDLYKDWNCVMCHNDKENFNHVWIYGVSAGKRDQIDKKIFFEIINVLDQMIKSTSILLRNFFLKKISIWSLFPAPTHILRHDRKISTRINCARWNH